MVAAAPFSLWHLCAVQNIIDEQVIQYILYAYKVTKGHMYIAIYALPIKYSK